MSPLVSKKPLCRTFLVESVYETLLENILSGTLPSGAEVSEVALAQDLKVSRTPVHVAVTQLAKEGLIDHGPGRKPRVARFRREDVVEIYEMRMLLETAAVERAADRIEANVLADLARRAEQLAGEPDSPDWSRRALELDVALHDSIARSSANRRLEQEIAKYRRQVRAFCRIAGSGENLREALREHQAVLKALQHRNAALACQAMARHIQNRLDAVLEKVYPETA